MQTHGVFVPLRLMYLKYNKSIIDILSVADINHKNSKDIILNSIDDSVIS